MKRDKFLGEIETLHALFDRVPEAKIVKAVRAVAVVIYPYHSPQWKYRFQKVSNDAAIERHLVERFHPQLQILCYPE